MGDDFFINDLICKIIGEKIVRGGGEVVGMVEECNIFVGYYCDGE